MHLFSRSLHMLGPEPEVTDKAMAMASYVSKRAGQEFSLWRLMFGAPAGTFLYTTRVDGLAGVVAMGQAVAEDETWHAMVARSRMWSTGPPIDVLGEVVHGSLDAGPPPVGSVATFTAAVIANGAYASAIAWGADVAIHVEKVTGMRTIFLVETAGQFGGVRWIAISPDAKSADAASLALNADAAYIEKLGEIAHLFLPGSGHRAIANRIA